MNTIEKLNRLDNVIQHMKYYQEGYRDSILTLLHGEIKVWESLNIDTHPYSPDSARDISYKEGWHKATEDYNL